MRAWRTLRLSRRLLLATPPLAVVAATLVAKPASAEPKRKTYECAADLLQES